jgi:hypothetical protein
MATYLNAATEKRILVEEQKVRGTTERQIKGAHQNHPFRISP